MSVPVVTQCMNHMMFARQCKKFGVMIVVMKFINGLAILVIITGGFFLESSKPEYEIYHCQYCEGSEWSMIMDMMTIAEASEGNSTTAVTSDSDVKAGEHLHVFIDESYTPEFPRKRGGGLAYGALIVPEREIGSIEEGVANILQSTYRGSRPEELKYNKVKDNPSRLEKIGSMLVELLGKIRDAKLIVLYVPQEGFWSEQERSIKAVAEYESTVPDDNELKNVYSDESFQKAMRNAVSKLAQTVAACIAQHIASRNSTATIYFDPRTKVIDAELRAELGNFLPNMPVNVPFFRQGDSILTIPPSSSMERFGNRASFRTDTPSKESAGLQIADFIAGDLRRFFEENPKLLHAELSKDIVMNKNILLPKVNRISHLSGDLLDSLKNKNGTSHLPNYSKYIVNHLIANYSFNGQMRTINAITGEIFDLID